MFESDSPADFESMELFPDARGIVANAWNKFTDAKSYRRLYDKDWPRWYLLYAGRHWDGRQADWQATPVVNLTWSTIQTLVPIMLDNRPQMHVIARQMEYDKCSQIWEDMLTYHWERNNLDTELPKTLYNTMIFGNGFLKVLWNASLKGGEGDIEIVPVDPVHIFVSPYARTIEEAEYIIHAENLPRSKVAAIYGVPLDPNTMVGPEEPSLTLKRTVTSQSAGGPQGNVEYVRQTDGAATFQTNSSAFTSQGGNNEDELVTVIELWERKDGQLFQTVVANDKLIVPPRVPFEHGRYPFVHFVDVPHTWSIWAMGEVQQVEKLQLEINRRRGHILDMIRFSSNPILLVDPAAVDFESIVQRPGLVLPVEGGPGSAGWLVPPPIPNALFQINEIDKQDFDTVLGNVDVMQGRRPAGIEAGVAIEALQEAANVRMRLKVRHLENSLKKLGELLIMFMQEFYTTERIYRVVGPQVMMAGKPLTKDMTIMMGGAEGMPVPNVDEAEFEVRVIPGSTLPVSRTMQFQKVLTLYTMQLVDDEEVLKNSGIPRWDEVLQRSRMFWMQKNAMMQAMASEQAAVEEPVSDEELDQSMEENAPVEYTGG